MKLDSVGWTLNPDTVKCNPYAGAAVVEIGHPPTGQWFNPSLRHWHALGKTLNPEWPLIEKSSTSSWTVWICVWMNEWQNCTGKFEWSSGLEALYRNTDQLRWGVLATASIEKPRALNNTPAKCEAVICNRYTGEPPLWIKVAMLQRVNQHQPLLAKHRYKKSVTLA